MKPFKENRREPHRAEGYLRHCPIRPSRDLTATERAREGRLRKDQNGRSDPQCELRGPSGVWPGAIGPSAIMTEEEAEQSSGRGNGWFKGKRKLGFGQFLVTDTFDSSYNKSSMSVCYIGSFGDFAAAIKSPGREEGRSMLKD
ncbi:hypothetical protein VNO77_41673 [Canavalia gladiata]|uniref:Uncharacterized protein n=1 Tax=Canavalia gladiata TaxID=3824 RepID=A0AAN9K2R7_CANGL